MKIFLDTNVFYNDWFMRNANFKYLFHFLNNEWHSLIISDLVIQESENIRNRELLAALSEINTNLKKVQKLNASELCYKEKELGIEGYDLLSLIKSRTENVEEISYEDIPHFEVVSRAFHNKKPFMEGEKGYRDTLIWLSFIDYLVKNDVSEDVVFVTQNKNDFFKKIDKSFEFHPDLVNDIEQKGVKAKITPFTSLFDFINSFVDKDEHAIDHYKSEELFEDFIESSSVCFVTELSNIDLSHYLRSSIFETKVNNILNINAEVFEGLEDPEVISTRRLMGDDIYVSYSYNLRRFIIEVDIPEIDYMLNIDELDKIFYDVEISAGIATLTCYVRPYFKVSFIYNDMEEKLKNFEVANLKVC